MTILEYTIVVGIGAFFIPFTLFDGTKELPKKLIPVFTGFLIKIIVITICMFFVFYLFIQETVDIMTDNGGMNWVSFVTIVFTCVIGFVLTQNAPKIAQTLMTGQPQLSMGELVTAAGAKGMFAAATGDLKDKVRSAGNNFLHGGGKAGPGGHGGGSGGGAQAHQRSGQNTSRELGPEDSRTLNNTSNPTFQGATKFDTATQSNVNMTRKEFYDEKRSQGSSIGNKVALDLMTAAEKKQQAQKKDTSLGDKLTDGVRASE